MAQNLTLISGTRSLKIQKEMDLKFLYEPCYFFIYIYIYFFLEASPVNVKEWACILTSPLCELISIVITFTNTLKLKGLRLLSIWEMIKFSYKIGCSLRLQSYSIK